MERIIDPQTLSEEQMEAITKKFEYNQGKLETIGFPEEMYYGGVVMTLMEFFGEELMTEYAAKHPRTVRPKLPMDEKEIKRLSEHYAEAMCPAGDYCGGVYDDCRHDDMATCRNAAEPFLRWLTKDYCLVPRDRVRELCKLTSENGGSEDFGLIDGLTDWVCRNFNQEYNETVDNESQSD